MIRNITTGRLYDDVAEAATMLSVLQKEIRAHLNGELKRIRGQKLKHILPYKKRERRTVRYDLRKPVRRMSNGKLYTSVTSAARDAGVSVMAMSRHLRSPGRYKSVDGDKFIWFIRPTIKKYDPHTGDLFT